METARGNSSRKFFGKPYRKLRLSLHAWALQSSYAYSPPQNVSWRTQFKKNWWIFWKKNKPVWKRIYWRRIYNHSEEINHWILVRLACVRKLLRLLTVRDRTRKDNIFGLFTPIRIIIYYNFFSVRNCAMTPLNYVC